MGHDSPHQGYLWYVFSDSEEAVWFTFWYVIAMAGCSMVLVKRLALVVEGSRKLLGKRMLGVNSGRFLGCEGISSTFLLNWREKTNKQC